MTKKETEMPNHGPKNPPGTSDFSSTRGEPEQEGSLQPQPDLDQVIQGFSGSLKALKGIIKELTDQKEQEAAAALKSRASEEYYKELFSGAPGGYLVTDTRPQFKKPTRLPPPCCKRRWIFCWVIA